MSKLKTIGGILLGLLLLGGVIAVIAPTSDEAIHAASAQQQGERRWLAVAPGRIEPPSGVIKVAAPTIGIVSRVLVKVNDTVFAGEPMVLLNDDEVQARYASAEAQAAMRRRLRNEQPASGKAGERRNAEDAVADAEAAVFDAQNAVDRAAAEWRTSGAPTSTLTNARAALARAQDDLARKQSQLRSIEAPLPTPLEAQVAAARSDLALVRANLEKLRIRAPIDGTVLQVNINPGELATPQSAQPLLLLANLSTLNVRAELDERDIKEIKVGQAASIRASAFPDREFSGTVTSIAPLVEPSRLGGRGPANRTDVDVVEVVLKLNQPGPLTAGMRVDVYFGQDQATAKPKS